MSDLEWDGQSGDDRRAQDERVEVNARLMAAADARKDAARVAALAEGRGYVQERRQTADPDVEIISVRVAPNRAPMTDDQQSRKMSEDFSLKDLTDKLVKAEETFQEATARLREVSSAQTRVSNEVSEAQKARDLVADAVSRKLGKVPAR